MKILKFTFTLTTLIFLTSSRVQATSRRMPNFIRAMEQANGLNHAQSALYNPNCENAQVRDSKWVDESKGAILSEKDLASLDATSDRMKKTRFPGDGLIYFGRDNGELSNYGVASAWYPGDGKFATAAHSFIRIKGESNEVYWEATGSSRKPTEEEFGKYWVYVEGCVRRYQVKNVEVGTSNPYATGELDFAVIEFHQELCPQLKPYKIASIDESIFDNTETVATGYFFEKEIDPNFIGAPNELEVHAQYSSVGKIADRPDGKFVLNGQTVYKVINDTTKRGSGGSIKAVDGSGELVVVGMTVRSGPDDDRSNFNLALSPAEMGPFRDFLELHFPNLQVKNFFLEPEEEEEDDDDSSEIEYFDI